MCNKIENAVTEVVLVKVDCSKKKLINETSADKIKELALDDDRKQKD